MSANFRRAVALWLPTAVLATLFAGLTYATVQQSYRNGANDPQIQMAEDAAASLSDGSSSPDALTTGPPVDISTSLAPFTTVFDAQGKVIASTATLNGKIPQPPSGVLDSAKAGGIDTVTWQPQSDVRAAIAVVPYSGSAGSGTVLVGRSLTEVENRENELTLMVGIAWIVALIGAAVAALIGARLWGRANDPAPEDAIATRRNRAA